MSTRMLFTTIAITLGSLAACDGSSEPAAPTPRDNGTVVSRYDVAEDLVDDLNEHLRDLGDSECKKGSQALTDNYTSKIATSDAAACLFPNGSALYVLIVDSGEDVYRRTFSEARGPAVYLRGPNWIAIGSSQTPEEALSWFRETLGAAG